MMPVERCLAACGPGLADHKRYPRVRAAMEVCLPEWLERFDLHLDIIPVLSMKTGKPRPQPLYNVRVLSEDIAAHQKRRLNPREPRPTGMIGGLLLLQERERRREDEARAAAEDQAWTPEGEGKE